MIDSVAIQADHPSNLKSEDLPEIIDLLSPIIAGGATL